MLSALKTTAVGTISFVLIVFVTFFGYNVYSLGLGTVSGDYFKGWMAVIVLLGGAWLFKQGLGKFGTVFMFAAGLMIVTITVRHRSPGLTHLATASSDAVSHRADVMAVDIDAARELPCDNTTPKLKFFDRRAGRQLVWAAEDEDGRFHCFDRPGHHPQTDNILVAVDRRLAAVILRQAPPAQPQPVPVTVQTVPVAVPQVRPTPLPELGQGTLRELGEGLIR